MNLKVLMCVATLVATTVSATAGEFRPYPCYNAQDKQGRAVVACGHYSDGGTKIKADFTFSHASQPSQGQAWLRSVPDGKSFICEVMRGSKNGSVKGCHPL